MGTLSCGLTLQIQWDYWDYAILFLLKKHLFGVLEYFAGLSNMSRGLILRLSLYLHLSDSESLLPDNVLTFYSIGYF